jgi:chromosome segregation ATPase
MFKTTAELTIEKKGPALSAVPTQESRAEAEVARLEEVLRETSLLFRHPGRAPVPAYEQVAQRIGDGTLKPEEGLGELMVVADSNRRARETNHEVEQLLARLTERQERASRDLSGIRSRIAQVMEALGDLYNAIQAKAGYNAFRARPIEVSEESLWQRAEALEEELAGLTDRRPAGPRPERGTDV